MGKAYLDYDGCQIVEDKDQATIFRSKGRALKVAFVALNAHPDPYEAVRVEGGGWVVEIGGGWTPELGTRGKEVGNGSEDI